MNGPHPPSPRRAAAAAVGVLALAATLGCGGGGPAARAPVETSAVGELESLGEGFVVWESDRGGAWRIWRRDLDGSPPRPLSPDEPGRAHCCAHVSPDGSRLVYLSLEPGQTGYEEEGGLGELRLMAADGSGQRVVAPAARTYFENRAAVWHGGEQVVYIDGERRTVLADLATGDTRRLTGGEAPPRGRLVDPTKSVAASGLEGFFRYDAERRRVVPRTPLGGCQFYFSQDGSWGFWMAGAGGPIRAQRLPAGEPSTVLAKNDPRLPEGLGYLYFPMLSADASLLAFAASPGDHDHFRADYEIFVAEVDPGTLELAGPPLRWTRDPATDRFPDVYRVPLALGRRAGEAPFTVRLELGEGPWEVEWGDGATARGATAVHTYDTPGRYQIEARSGGRRLDGQAVVAPARPPRPLSAELVAGGTRLAVRFDEPVRAEGARLELASGVGVTLRGEEAGGRVLVAELERRLDRGDRLLLSGVTDRAQSPNELVPVELEVAPPSWPSDRRHLEFLWETGAAPNLVPALEGAGEQSVVLTAHGAARLDHDFALRPAGGYFVAPPELANRLRFGAQGRNALSLEAVIEPDPSRAPGRRVIVAQEGSLPNFRLTQQGGSIFFALRVGVRGPEAVREVRLFEVPAGRKSHVAVSFTPGRLRAWLDGEAKVDSAEIQGDLFHWRSDDLRFGAGPGGRAAWRGRLEGVAIYSRPFEPGEPAENHLRYRRALAARPTVPAWTVEASLIGCAPAPDPAEIAPYREALTVCRYRVERAIEGDLEGGSVAVTAWALLDGAAVEPPGSSAEVVRLVLERFADNPQLESVYLASEGPAPAVDSLYYVVGGG
ncbi:MAG: LamG-like jellyroll fold domain-containing protein [Thermoanaerobaculia bacterium]|nr:LamG-like jellyroll fold domain-containing protein [Thermoanaerobaculia bacterium]